MLQSIRDRSSGIIAKTIVGLIAVTFVVTGLNFFVVGDGEVVIAEVGGQEITERQLVSRIDLERRQLLQVLGDPGAVDEERLRTSVLNALLDEAVVLDYGDQLAFAAPDALVDQVIADVPQFQRDGQFDPVLFDRGLAQAGLSRLQFRERLRRDLIDYQIRGGVEGSVMVLPKEIERLAQLQAQRRSGELVRIAPQQFEVDPAQFAEADILAFYNDNQTQFMLAERVGLDLVTLTAADFDDQVTVSDADVRSAYEAEVNAASSNTERRVRHILINAGDGARDRITAAKRAVDSGQAFSDVAREFSEDLASRDAGGDLGFAPVGTYDPAFEDAVAALPLNQVSDPVETSYGFHLVEVLEERGQVIAPFEAREAGIRDELRARMSDQMLRDQIEEFSNIAFSGTLEELSAVFGVSIEAVEPFGRADAPARFARPGVLRQAFDPALRESSLNAEVFELEQGVWATFRIRDYQPSAVAPIEAVKDQILAALVSEQQMTQALELANQVQAHWNAGALGLPAAVSSSAVERTEFKDLARTDLESVAEDAMAVIFQAPAPGSKPSIRVNANRSEVVSVVRVDAITYPVSPPQDRVQLQGALAGLKTSQEGQAFMNVLATKAEVSNP